MLRHAEDDFSALRIANAMESVNVKVVSITDAGDKPFSNKSIRFNWMSKNSKQ